MNPAEILAFYDETQRQNNEPYGARREVTPEVVRFVNLLSPNSYVMYSRLNESNADRVIQEQIDYYKGLGHNFEWKLYDHDTPADLKDRLVAHGFAAPDEEEALLALDLENLPSELQQSFAIDIREITDPDQLGDVFGVQEQVWGEDFSDFAAEIGEILRYRPDALKMFVAYVDDVPVSSAWIDFQPGSPFSGLWGGSTLPQYRKRGIYTALLAKRAHLAKERGVRFLTIDASPMSRPIVEKHGFQFLGYTYPYEWTLNKEK